VQRGGGGEEGEGGEEEGAEAEVEESDTEEEDEGEDADFVPESDGEPNEEWETGSER